MIAGYHIFVFCKLTPQIFVVKVAGGVDNRFHLVMILHINQELSQAVAELVQRASSAVLYVDDGNQILCRQINS